MSYDTYKSIVSQVDTKNYQLTVWFEIGEEVKLIDEDHR
jgi:hypothetical protein